MTGRFPPLGLYRRLKRRIAPPVQGGVDLRGAYRRHVAALKASMPHAQAMEAALVRHYGLKPQDYLIDVGCGSGRLAQPLSAYLSGRYLGTDLVPDLVADARKLVGRGDWRFEVVDHIAIPEADGLSLAAPSQRAYAERLVLCVELAFDNCSVSSAPETSTRHDEAGQRCCLRDLSPYAHWS